MVKSVCTGFLFLTHSLQRSTIFPMDIVRQTIMTAADPIVVKVGTRVLTNQDGVLDIQQVESIATQLASLWQQGCHVVLVSSGAVGAGLGRLGISQRPTDLADLQAAAAVGQTCLIEAYNQALEPHDLHAAQILLTADGLHDRTRYLNVRNTLFALFRKRAVPIVNENDTVSTEELELSFGDNDRLAALVTNLIRAPLLILLSDVEGLYDGDPRDPASKIVSTITDLPAAQDQWVHDDSRVQLSTGGMASKLKAAQIAIAAGENVVIANGRRHHVLSDILAGADVGTLILASGRSIDSRKRWIGWSAQPCGRLMLDEGAQHAIRSNGSSLLAVGLTAVEGDFDKGDVVGICGPDGNEIARGLINYTAQETRVIAGHTTQRMSELLGHCPYQEVIHRDNLVLL
jgi:glutamate 5-kinase